MTRFRFRHVPELDLRVETIARLGRPSCFGEDPAAIQELLPKNGDMSLFLGTDSCRACGSMLLLPSESQDLKLCLDHVLDGAGGIKRALYAGWPDSEVFDVLDTECSNLHHTLPTVAWTLGPWSVVGVNVGNMSLATVQACLDLSARDMHKKPGPAARQAPRSATQCATWLRVDDCINIPQVCDGFAGPA